MLSFFKKMRYRNEVLEHVKANVLMIGSDGKLIEKHPGLRAMVEASFEDDEPVEQAAAVAATSFLTSAIEDIDQDRKQDIYAALSAWSQTENMRSIRKQLREGTLHQDMLLTRIQWFFLMLMDMLNERQLTESYFDICMGEVNGALRGLSHDQRVEERVMKIAQEIRS